MTTIDINTTIAKDIILIINMRRNLYTENIQEITRNNKIKIIIKAVIVIKIILPQHIMLILHNKISL